MRILIFLVFLLAIPASADMAQALESDQQVSAPGSPMFNRDRLRAFILTNFDQFAKSKQPLPALSEDSVNFVSESYRPDDVTFVLESFSGLFPGDFDKESKNVIEIVDADSLSTAIAAKIRTIEPVVADAILAAIEDGTLCWSGKIPTTEGNVPIVLVSQRSDQAFLSTCLYRGVMAQMGVQILYKDRFPVAGRLDAILSHIANVTAMHLFYECRQHIRASEFRLARSCVESRFDARY